MRKLEELFIDYMGRKPIQCCPITGSGSNRQYFRLTDDIGKSLIGVKGNNIEENKAFIYLSSHFASKGLPVPQVLAVSSDMMCYLQSDLGRRSLYDALSRGRECGNYNKKEQELLCRTIALLPHVQIRGAEGLDFDKCYPMSMMDTTGVMFDLNYFKYCFLMPSGVSFHELRLEKSFRQLAQLLVQPGEEGFLYRDFQARNIMLDDQDRPYLIDYQGGRRGPILYDLASFLWQASARYNDTLREMLIQEYLKTLRTVCTIDEKRFRKRLMLFVFFRQLQVLGTYGLRGYTERKKYFLDSIPTALQNLSSLLQQHICPDPYLNEVLEHMIDKLTIHNVSDIMSSPLPLNTGEKGMLRVRVFSFAYNRGIPVDESGNGGGYVFDCRSTHNPGRYAPYKQLTGLDEPVIHFLEEDGEIIKFLHHSYALAEKHVERYLCRGFKDLMFSFGCTGGQHRSVYAAQHLAEYLHEKYGIHVELCHREQGISSSFPARIRRAMIFAAGLGTRLKPLTDNIPKALVALNGQPLLDILMDKLQRNGFGDVVINIHHFADQIEAWSKDKPGVRLSDERNRLLETGGGLRHAAPLLEDTDRFLIHNVDILSNVNLQAFWLAGASVDAMLLVSERETQRYLLFDDTMKLVGWTNLATGEVKTPYKRLNVCACKRLAFAGIHQMRTCLLSLMQDWPKNFSVIDFYLSICDRYDIRGYVQSDLQLMDVGKIENLAQAEAFHQMLSN